MSPDSQSATCSDAVLTITRRFAAPQQQLFAMWTDAELVMQWFCPAADMTVPEAEIDARNGGHYRIVMQNKDGETYSPSGVYELVQPHEKLVFSWKWADSDVTTRVTVTFRAIGASETELTLRHEGFSNMEMSKQHKSGWVGSLHQLEQKI